MAGLGRIDRSIFEHRYRDNKWGEWLAEPVLSLINRNDSTAI